MNDSSSKIGHDFRKNIFTKERIGYIKRDSTRSRQTLPRAAKSTTVHAGKDHSTDTEDEYKESPGNKE
jgi:hypothetical protein